MKNYYDILQVTQDADVQEIRRAFRRLSMEYHPDRHGGDRHFEEKFKELNEAYRVLRDPVQRWEYKQARERSYSRPAPRSDWRTPDYASGRSTSRKRKATARAEGSWQASPPPDAGIRGMFWSLAFLLVFLYPFLQAGKAPVAHTGTTWDRYEVPAAAPVSIKEKIDRRYARDVRLLSEVLKTDPSLRGLDMDTGYYEWEGNAVRFSWDIVQLVREKNWKAEWRRH